MKLVAVAVVVNDNLLVEGEARLTGPQTILVDVDRNQYILVGPGLRTPDASKFGRYYK